MDNCRFYKTSRMIKMTQSQIRRAGMMPISVNKPWCEHENSRVTQKDARKRSLTMPLPCGGRYEDCPIGYRPD